MFEHYAVRMKRREFITLLGGAAAAWPLAARAQQPERVRHIGMLVGYDDPAIKAFQQELERLGWFKGRNIHIDYRYAPAGAQVRRSPECPLLGVKRTSRKRPTTSASDPKGSHPPLRRKT